MAVQETTLLAALDLLTSAAPTQLTTSHFDAQALSATEKRRLTQQVARRQAWSLDGNIVSYGITARDHAPDELALTIYVKQKYPRELLDDSTCVPSELDLEGLNERVPTTIYEIGELRPQALTQRARPIPGGFSLGHLRSTGSFGCLVLLRGGDGTPLVLSNSHVLAAAGTARPGDPIYQPGPDESGVTFDQVAGLHSWQPFDFSADYANRIDAALATPLDPALFDRDIYVIGRPVGVRAPTRGMMIQKCGRTSGHTIGRVLDVNNRPVLRFPRPDGSGEGEVKFRDQVLCTRYSDRGDSGALVLDLENYAVGLHFAGSASASVFSPIQFVLDDLGVDLAL